MTIETLQEYGLEEMTDGEIGDFLTNQGMGVLGLPTESAPYLIPMSFGFDGGDRLYFSFFVGEESTKVELSERAELATFLAYSADSVFFWESVLLRGEITELPADEIGENDAALDNAWHLDLFDRAGSAGQLRLYAFEIEEQTGFKSMGLPPGIQQQRSARGVE